MEPLSIQRVSDGLRVRYWGYIPPSLAESGNPSLLTPDCRSVCQVAELGTQTRISKTKLLCASGLRITDLLTRSYIDDSLHDKWHLAEQNIENYKNHPRGQLLAAVYTGLYCCSWNTFSILQIDAEMKFHDCLLTLTYSRQISKWALQRWLKFQLEFLTVSIGFVESRVVYWAAVWWEVNTVLWSCEPFCCPKAAARCTQPYRHTDPPHGHTHLSSQVPDQYSLCERLVFNCNSNVTMIESS